MLTRSMEELSEGMVTKEPVLDATGNVVLREGIRLTKKIITALRHRGITSISVDGAERQSTHEHDDLSGLTEAERNRTCRQIEERIDRIFTGQKDGRMLELAEAAKRYHKSKIR